MVSAAVHILRKADIISESDMEARRNQQDLLAITRIVLQNNLQLSQRLSRLEDHTDDRDSIHTQRQYSLAPTVTVDTYERGPHDRIETDDETDILPGELPPSLQFERDLNTSRVYRRAKRHSMDYSICSSKVLSHAWTKLSDISLSGISVISHSITYHSKRYEQPKPLQVPKRSA